MEFKDFLLLNEMLVQSFGPNPDIIIAFRQHIWLLSTKMSAEEFDKIKKEIASAIVAEAPTYASIFQHMEENPYSMKSDLWDFIGRLNDEFMDVFTASWDKQKKTIHLIPNYFISPNSSILVKKVAMALNARRVTTDNSDGVEQKFTMKNGVLGKLPEVMYHGTTSKHLRGILKFGLMPGESESNYPTVVSHHDKVFLASQKDVARTHAYNAIYRNKTPGSNSIYNSVVLGFKLPDPSKILPDYDLDRGAVGEKTYAHNAEYKGPQASVNSEKLISHSGLIGYQGRIPANNLVYMEVNSGSEINKWTKVNIEKFKRYLKKYGDPYEAFLLMGLTEG